MVDLTTKYMGLELKNPIIIGSSGLTDNANDIAELEKNGAAAVVLKSIFEEEIMLETEHLVYLAEKEGYDAKAFDYYDYKLKEEALSSYVKLIQESKKAVDIPIIASINCVSGHEWPYYAKKIEEAGADAIELNVFALPSNMHRTSAQNEKLYFTIAQKVKEEIKIPVSLKISHYSAALGPLIRDLSNTGIDALVLFNRFWSPDFDIDNFKVISTNVLSRSEELTLSLRWIAIMANHVACDLSASSGIHDGKGVIKQILAGATTTQVVSAIYRHGKPWIGQMLEELTNWMEKHDFTTLDQFRGKMSQAKSEDPAMYERVQFMRYFRGHEAH